MELLNLSSEEEIIFNEIQEYASQDNLDIILKLIKSLSSPMDLTINFLEKANNFYNVKKFIRLYSKFQNNKKTLKYYNHERKFEIILKIINQQKASNNIVLDLLGIFLSHLANEADFRIKYSFHSIVELLTVLNDDDIKLLNEYANKNVNESKAENPFFISRITSLNLLNFPIGEFVDYNISVLGAFYIYGLSLILATYKASILDNNTIIFSSDIFYPTNNK